MTILRRPTATNKGKRSGIATYLKVGTWNVRGICHKENELENELKRMKIDIAAITETKKKGKGSKELNEYIMFYNGVELHKRAAAGVALLIHKSWKNKIHSYTCINERMIILRVKIERGYLTVLSIYAPEEGRDAETNKFYNLLQNTVDKINKNDYLILTGDFNARVGNTAIKGILGTNGEPTLNSNGRRLIDFSAFNGLKITNTFFKHKDNHKYTWSERGTRTIIDYVLVNAKTAALVEDTRVYRGADISSDHFLVLSKIKILRRWITTKKSEKIFKETFKVNLLTEDSVKFLYQRRINQYLEQYPVSNNINLEWESLKTIIIKAASEAIGKRNRRYKNRGLRIWNDEIAEHIRKKKEAYLKFLHTASSEDRADYKMKSAIVKRETRKLNREHWNRYVANLEYDVHGKQDKAFKILKNLNKEMKDNVQLNPIAANEWLDFFETLWTTKEQDPFVWIPNDVNVDPITLDELMLCLKQFKNKKSPGSDDINIELLKYAPPTLLIRLLDLLNRCWKTGHVPEEWNLAIVIPIYKKGNRHDCNNYRGISLLNSCYKLYSKILNIRLTTISEHIISNYQHGFRKGRSCTDCIFTMTQLIEKRKEHNLPTFLAFIDYEKAFDKVNRNKLWNIMIKSYPQHLVRAIQSLYHENQIMIEINGKRNNTKKAINQGVRQGCPLSPALFNIYIDDIINRWKNELKNNFCVNNIEIDTLLYADDQVLIANSEDGLQRAIYKLNIVAREYNMKISEKKTKVTAFKGKYPLRSKIVINDMIIEQVMYFKYLGFNVGYDTGRDINDKLQRFQHICGTLRRTLIGRVRKETILKFYNIMAIPTLLYGSECWTLTQQLKQRLEAAEMRFLRAVAGYRLIDQRRSEDIRRELQIEDIISKIKNYQIKWLEHVERMNQDRFPRVLLNYDPKGRRDQGRPCKRWRDQF